MDEQSIQQVEVSGDWLVDAETGEIIGMSPDSNRYISRVDNVYDLEKYMANLMDMEADLAARKLALAAIVENANKLIGNIQARIDWYKLKHQDEVRAVAEGNLARGSKTYRCVYGTVSFRKKNPRIAIKDDAQAIEWAEANVPEAVVVSKKVLVSKLDIENIPSESDAFEIIPAEESMAIKTL
jgi:phage host-nuclease inhibitor protein Gam